MGTGEKGLVRCFPADTNRVSWGPPVPAHAQVWLANCNSGFSPQEPRLCSCLSMPSSPITLFDDVVEENPFQGLALVSDG